MFCCFPLSKELSRPFLEVMSTVSVPKPDLKPWLRLVRILWVWRWDMMWQ